jgi:addiction module HigA family antidote
MQMHNPAHPGEILKELIGEIEVTAFATRLGVDRTTLSRLLNGHAGISATMALKLEHALGTTAEMWMNMQSQYDLWKARRSRQLHITGGTILVR